MGLKRAVEPGVQPLVLWRKNGVFGTRMGVHRLLIDRDSSGPFAGVAVLRLSQPDQPVVVLNRALIQAIDVAIYEILNGKPLKGFVLASDSRVFVAGADLKEIMGLGDDELHEYLRFGQKVYGRIATMPCTTVAAINGAAVGGGLEIAMHCDRLIAAAPVSKDRSKPARPYPVGLPEAGLSICPGWGGTNMLPARMDGARAIQMTASGQTMSVLEAREAGLIEELVDDPSQLLVRARAVAMTPKASPRTEPVSVSNPEKRSAAKAALEKARGALPATQAAQAVAACVEAGVTKGWQAALDAERENLVRLRNTEEGRGAIQAFFEKK